MSCLDKEKEIADTNTHNCYRLRLPTGMQLLFRRCGGAKIFGSSDLSWRVRTCIEDDWWDKTGGKSGNSLWWPALLYVTSESGLQLSRCLRYGASLLFTRQHFCRGNIPIQHGKCKQALLILQSSDLISRRWVYSTRSGRVIFTHSHIVKRSVLCLLKVETNIVYLIP
jgi:hypothetical protein